MEGYEVHRRSSARTMSDHTDAPGAVRSDRCFQFDAGREQVWDAITHVDRYQEWWPWLSEFEGAAFSTGAAWRCAVEPPLPYSLHFDVTLTEVVNGESVRASIGGDIVGSAQLTAADRDGGCELRLISELSPARRMLRLVSRLAPPVARFGHDWVLDTGARRFRAVALPP